MTTAGFQEATEHSITPGTIVVWSDLLSNIPAGWALCDGNNGTPNLLDQMPKSVPDATTAPGTTGGQDSFTLSSTQMPSHSHTGSSSSGGGHTHPIGNAEMASGTNGGNLIAGAGSDYTVDSVSSHSHGSVTSNSTGSGGSINNLPKYYEVAFIMKT